jgi:hypothetical protein
MKKGNVFLVLLVLILGFILPGCDNGTNGGGDYTVVIKNTSSGQTIERVVISDEETGTTVIDETVNIGPGGQKTYADLPFQSGSFRVVIYDASGGGPMADGGYYRVEWAYPEDFPITHVWDGADITSIHADGKQY